MSDTKSDTKKILVVDDEMDISKTLAEHFKRKGYEVATAYDGEEGIAKAKEFLPDIILLDILMPVMDGISALKQLKSDSSTANIPVIMLTNLDTQDKVAGAMEAGTTHYLVKSDYSPEDLDKKVEEVLNMY